MNSLNLSFKNINAARRDELGYISPGSGVSSGKALTVPKSNYYVPPPPIFNQTRYVSPGSGVSSGAGLGINPANDQNDALQVLNAANSRGKFETIASLVSQTLSGVLPRQTQQIGGQNVPNYQSQGQLYTEAQVLEYQRQVEAQKQNYNDPNGGAGGVVNQIVSFVTNNPLAVGGVFLAFYLLNKEPPARTQIDEQRKAANTNEHGRNFYYGKRKNNTT